MIEGLQLAPNVHAVVAEDRAVFLDVGEDRYFKLDRARTQVLCDVEAPERGRLVANLVARGLVSERVPLPEAPVADVAAFPHRRGAGLLSVLGACVWARAALARTPFLRIVQEVGAQRGAQSLDRELVHRFLFWRPFYPRNYNCLFDTLAIVRFLRTRDMCGDWVFGVRSGPFAAHCWLEDEGECLNDDPDFVAPYIRMLIV